MTSFFHNSGLYLATYARRQIISCLAKASARPCTLNANHLRDFVVIWSPIEDKMNSITFKEVNSFILNMFDRGIIFFTAVNHADYKGLK